MQEPEAWSGGSAQPRAATDGTKWTNEQLLFHMLFGYLLIHNLRPLGKGFARLPRPASKTVAATLMPQAGPSTWSTNSGSHGGGRVLGRSGMKRLMDAVVRRLQRFVTKASEVELSRGMHFPTRWDPYFSHYMTLRDIYHYPTQHYDHHRRQLTLSAATAGPPHGR